MPELASNAEAVTLDAPYSAATSSALFSLVVNDDVETAVPVEARVAALPLP
jgi:hypothetical protein